MIGNKLISNINKSATLRSDFINRTLDATTARDSFVCLRIFYESLSYTSITESPQMTIVSLLGSIGGNLGLFLGVSAFSLCEIVEVIIEIVYVLNVKTVV